MAKEKKVKLDENGEPKESRLGVILVTVIIVIIWIAIMCILIKLDVGGFGSTVMKPVLKDVPVINKILPDGDSDNVNQYGYKYSTLSDALERIRELEEENTALRQASDDNAEKLTELMAEVSRLEVFENNQVKYEELKKIFDEEVVFNEKAPDINEYKTWYEALDPTNAASIYERVLKEKEYSAAIEDLANTYSKMDAKAAAAIFEEMTSDMDKVATLLLCMKDTKRQAILAEMDPTYAGKLTKIMYPSDTQ